MNEMVSPLFLYPTDKSVEGEDIFSYLVDKRTIQRFVSELCNNLHHPVALIDYNTLTTETKPEKLESMVENFPMRRSCSILRKCAGDKYCTKCDMFHAKCMDLDVTIIKINIQNCADHPLEYFDPMYSSNRPIVLDGFDRPIIEYHCPMLGYRELVFPLLYNGKIFGVVFAGQIMVYGENDPKINEIISERFFNNMTPEKLFTDFVDRYNDQDDGELKLDCDGVKNLIMTSDNKAKQYDNILGFKPKDVQDADYYSKNFKTKVNYYAFIRSVCDELKITEKKIASAYEVRRKRNFEKILGKITEQYFNEYDRAQHTNYKNKHDLRTAELESAWKALEVFAKGIKLKFDLVRIILLFGDGQRLVIEDSGKKRFVFAVSSEDSVSDSLMNKYNDESVVFSSDSLKSISDHDNSLAKPEILEGLSEKLRDDNSILIRCHDIAMLLQVYDLEGQRQVYEYLIGAIENELVRINSIIALCTANLLKEKYLLTLRMYRHENAHISTRLMGTINRYFVTTGQRLRFLDVDDDRQRLIGNDLKNTVQLISNIADNIGFVTGSSIAKDPTKDSKRSFDVVDMLYKWQIMFRDELKNRNLDIVIYRGGYESSTIGYKMSEYLKRIANEITKNNRNYVPAPREITINPRLFELLVYNIVDNAVKYAYRGTNIYLMWNRLGDYYELSVTSYGPRMPLGDSMYELYIRGTDGLNPTQGDGLGLYVVKTIANMLGIKISHDSQRISKYNAPLIPWYSKWDFSEVKNYTKFNDRELKAYDDESQVNFAINDYVGSEITDEDLTTDYLRQRIELETCRTTFWVRIPINNN